MRIIDAQFFIEDNIDGVEILRRIEKAGRTCYKSETKITKESAKKFAKQLLKSGHESVIEHEKITVRIVCDRGISHEIVRHRIASYSQESTRYCNYSDKKFGKEISVIRPIFWDKTIPNDKKKIEIWEKMMVDVEEAYIKLIELGASPQEARSILPNSLKTEIVTTMNIREWRHFFKLRTSKAAHPQMQEIARPLLNHFKKLVPILFDDIKY